MAGLILEGIVKYPPFRKNAFMVIPFKLEKVIFPKETKIKEQYKNNEVLEVSLDTDRDEILKVGDPIVVHANSSEITKNIINTVIKIDVLDLADYRSQRSALRCKIIATYHGSIYAPRFNEEDL